MDSRIIEFMKEYQISDLEIGDLKNIAPMIEVTSYEEFMANCELLAKYGYPKSDLDVLMLANPNIFAMSTKDLEQELCRLQNECEDIEVALKEDPYAI